MRMFVIPLLQGSLPHGFYALFCLSSYSSLGSKVSYNVSRSTILSLK